MHQAWDDGAIVDGFVQVFGEEVRPLIAIKTTKTKCGRRVSIDQISNGHATCFLCQAKIAEEAESRVMLLGYDRAMKEFGFEYANSLTRAELIAAATL